jgi:hypothetical protein
LSMTIDVASAHEIGQRWPQKGDGHIDRWRQPLASD